MELQRASITVDSGVPPSVVEVVMPLLMRWSPILPSWVGAIVVLWDSEETQCYAKATVRFEYRRFVLTICPKFLDQPPSRMEHTIVHELCHAYTTPINVAACDSIRLIVGDAYPTPGSRIAEEYLNERVEGCTEDLVYLVRALVSGAVPLG